MTMHLVGPYLTTTNYRKPKQKPRTKAAQKKFEQSHVEYNKSMKRMGLHDQMMSLDEYDLYCKGLWKPKVKATPKKESYQHKDTSYRETVRIPSLNSKDCLGFAPRKEPQKYTGTLIKGIATMHKSNAVPVINDEQILEIAKMRRN
jgi:hypothetical protein